MAPSAMNPEWLDRHAMKPAMTKTAIVQITSERHEKRSDRYTTIAPFPH